MVFSILEAVPVGAGTASRNLDSQRGFSRQRICALGPGITHSVLAEWAFPLICVFCLYGEKSEMPG